MTTSIPSVSYPDGFTPPTPSAGGSSSLPALPALSSYLTGANQGVGTGTDGTDPLSVNGMTSGQIATNQATGGTGNPAVAPASGNVWSQLGAWLASIALPGTLALVAVALIIFSTYKAVKQ